MCGRWVLGWHMWALCMVVTAAAPGTLVVVVGVVSLAAHYSAWGRDEFGGHPRGANPKQGRLVARLPAPPVDRGPAELMRGDKPPGLNHVQAVVITYRLNPVVVLAVLPAAFDKTNFVTLHAVEFVTDCGMLVWVT